jgi:DNA-3-methyladenine glycosylase
MIDIFTFSREIFMNTFIPLERTFFDRDTVIVAQELLGKLIVRVIDENILVGSIVETEAYTVDDPACHAFRGVTTSNRALFGEAGHAYIYFIYGNHYCFNAVSYDSSSQKAGGVLIRAIEPLMGIPVMQQYRITNNVKNLTNGPGKLAQALHVTKQHYAIDLTRPGALYIAHPINPIQQVIYATTRIGITKGAEKLWRFYTVGNPFVSRLS